MKQTYWNLVLTSGLILGLLCVGATALEYAMGNAAGAGWITNILSIAAIVWVLLTYGKKAAAIKDPDGLQGFTYGQAFGFSILLLLLSGVIVALGQWLFQNVIDPEHYTKLFQEGVAKQIELNPAAADQILEIANKTREFRGNPFIMIPASMFSMALMGGFVALITSVFVKRKPQF